MAKLPTDLSGREVRAALEKIGLRSDEMRYPPVHGVITVTEIRRFWARSEAS